MIGQTVTVTRYRTDRYGDRRPVLTFRVAHCAFAPRASSEDTGRSQQVTAEADLHTPDRADILAADVVTLDDGTQWEVTGVPARWRSPYGRWLPGRVVPLTRITG